MNTRYLIPGTIKQGYLTKAPPLNKGTWTTAFKGWKRRWCILYESGHDLFLQYYDDEESARGNSAPKSNVSLKSCRKVDVDLQHSSYKNVFALHLPERIYYFSSTSHYEMTEWSDAICNYLQLEQKEDKLPSQQQPLHNTLPASSSHYHSTPSQYSSDSTYSVYSLSTHCPDERAQTLPPSSATTCTLPNSLYSSYSAPNKVQLRSLPPPPPEEAMQHRSLPPPPMEETNHPARRLLPPRPGEDDEVFEPMAPLAPPRSPSQQRARSPPPPLPPPYQGIIVESKSKDTPPVPPPRFGSSTLPRAVPNMYISNPSH